MSISTVWSTINNIGGYLLGGTGSKRQMIISCEDDKFTLPVTPWKYQVDTGQNNKVVDILDYGEAQLFGNPKLERLSFSCFFPATKHEYPFVVGDELDPADCVEKIKKWKEGKKPVRVIITDSPLNLMMAIKEFNWHEQDCSRDIYYEMDLLAWKDLNTPQANNEKEVDEKTGLKNRSVEKTPPRPNSLKRAQDILDVSRKAYGKFTYWRNIAKGNGLENLALKTTRDLIVKKRVKLP